MMPGMYRVQCFNYMPCSESRFTECEIQLKNLLQNENLKMELVLRGVVFVKAFCLDVVT